ncbi:MAG TPA: hypothetical protein VHD87_15595 [Acidimicrobiales bacterium]|nr:hypothetical protein [Acidimicrobiales bacterium]
MSKRRPVVDGSKRWSPEEWTKALRAYAKAVAGTGQRHTRHSYDRWRSSLKDPFSVPSAKTGVTAEMWKQRCRAAGLDGYVRDFRTPTYTDDDIRKALRAAAGRGGTISEARYLEWAATQPNRPSLPTVITRFGSWAAACNAAGVNTGGAGGAMQRSDDEILKAIRKCARATKTPPHASSYNDWARANDAPNLSTVVRRFGSWAQAVEKARQGQKT